MKVLLIGAHAGNCTDLNEQAYKEGVVLAPSLGLHRLAGYLRKRDIFVDVLDPNLGNPKPVISNGDFDIIGFSPTHHTLEYDMALAYYAQKVNPNVLLIAGGIEATFNFRQIFDISPISIIIIGEGENPLLDICRGKNIRDIKGLYFRDGEDVKFTGYRSVFSQEEFNKVSMNIDFRHIPYETYWDHLEDRKNVPGKHTLRLFTANRCPLGCSFCSSTNFLNYSSGCPASVAFLSPSNITRLIKEGVRYHPSTDSVFFNDDSFTLNRKRVAEFCLLAKKDKILASVKYLCLSKVEDMSRSLLEIMAQAGFVLIGYGVESFSKRQLAEFRKTRNIQKIHDTIHDTLAVGIIPYLNIILTSPDCTVNDISITVDECVKYAEKGAEISMVLYTWAYPGCSFLDIDKKECIVEKTQIPITDKSFLKSTRFIIKNPQVKKIIEQLDLEKKRELIKRKYGFKRIYAKLNSLILLYTLSQILNPDNIEILDKIFLRYSLCDNKKEQKHYMPKPDAI
ncbi:MAG: cobalamin-dependent protein [Candidatus Omnitrophica bacterium]|nr:cobalamin-dependent protein [Candidatus Omnitrophota bacterium]